MSMSEKEKEAIIKHLDILKRVIKADEVDAIAIAYKFQNNRAGTTLLGDEVSLFGLAGKLNSDILMQSIENQRELTGEALRKQLNNWENGKDLEL